jgi:hypothetical protein
MTEPIGEDIERQPSTSLNAIPIKGKRGRFDQARRKRSATHKFGEERTGGVCPRYITL